MPPRADYHALPALPPVTASTPSAPRPVTGTAAGADRIHTLDVLRGVAICGILLMNIYSMGGITEFPIRHFPAAWNIEWMTWGAQTLFVQGAMRGLFTLLFGAGMLLMLRRAEGSDGGAAPLDVWTRRCLALMGFGTALWLVFLWPGEILWNYGVTGLFLLAFRTARPRVLIAAALLLIAGLSASDGYWTREQAQQLQQGRVAAVMATEGHALDTEQRAAVKVAVDEQMRLHPTPAMIADKIAQRTHVRSLLHWSEGYWTTENLTVTGWVDVAESLAFMLVGMALFRAGILTGQAQTRTYVVMAVLGYGGGLALRGFHVALLARSGLDMSLPVASPALWAISEGLFQPARLLVTLGHVGAIALLFRSGALGEAVTLRALGRMTLSVYCLQAILGSILFYGFGLVGAFTLAQLWLIAGGIWIVSAIFCRQWLAHHPMGPAETLLRRIAYGSRAAVAKPAPR